MLPVPIRLRDPGPEKEAAVVVVAGPYDSAANLAVELEPEDRSITY